MGPYSRASFMRLSMGLWGSRSNRLATNMRPGGCGIGSRCDVAAICSFSIADRLVWRGAGAYPRTAVIHERAVRTLGIPDYGYSEYRPERGARRPGSRFMASRCRTPGLAA